MTLRIIKNQTEIQYVNSISKHNDMKIDLDNFELTFLKYFLSTHNYNLQTCHNLICNCDEIIKHVIQLKRIKTREIKN